jgi:thioredoxin reductase
MDHEVIVVGAGPAGVAACLTLKDLGTQVLLLEKGEVGTGVQGIGELGNMPGFPGKATGPGVYPGAYKKRPA